MSDVREQIEARLAEVEAVANYENGELTDWPENAYYGLSGANPGSVLAWVAGIRAVVEMHRFDGDWCVMCHWCDERGCPTIRAIAAIWDETP